MMVVLPFLFAFAAGCSGGGGGSTALPIGTQTQGSPAGSPSLGGGAPTAVPGTTASANPSPTGYPAAGQTPSPARSAPGQTPGPGPSTYPTQSPVQNPTATPGPRATPTAVPTTPGTHATPTPAPTTAPTARPTSAPAPTNVSDMRRCIDVFTSSPMCRPIPQNPAISPNSAAWAGMEFANRNYFGAMTVGQNDQSEPLTDLPSGAAVANLPLLCNVVSWAQYECSTHGLPVGSTFPIASNEQVSAGSDHHCSTDSHAARGEFDGWECPDPMVYSGSLRVGGAGFCPWAGDGTNCSGSTATNIATSLGGIDQNDLNAAEADPVHGSLPYALSTSAVCADASYVYPASASDGSNTNGSPPCAGHTGPGGRPPEGTRWFLALHDADVDATNNLPYVKAILRTMDEDHMGGVITDTNWSGAPGLSPAFRNQPFAQAASEAGVSGSTITLPISNNGILLQSAVVFCSNGTC